MMAAAMDSTRGRMMSDPKRSVVYQGNYVQHSWPVLGGDVRLLLTLTSKVPMRPGLYFSLQKLIEAGDEFAAELDRVEAEYYSEFEGGRGGRQE